MVSPLTMVPVVPRERLGKALTGRVGFEAGQLTMKGAARV